MTKPIKKQYRVIWRDGNPGIEIKKTGCRKAQTASGRGYLSSGVWSDSIAKALASQLRRMSFYFSQSSLNSDEMINLESGCCLLRRLRVKLERHGLIPFEE